MKIILITILTLAYSSNSFGQLMLEYGLARMGKDDACQITRASHDSWIDWTDNDDYIVYISSKSGKNNLYRIKVNDIELSEVKTGFYGAKYLLDTLAKDPNEQLTFETKRTVECPVIIPNSNKVAFRTYFCNESYECLDFDLRTYDFETKETEIIIKEQIDLFDFIDNEKLLFVPYGKDSIIKVLDLKTGKKNTFMQFDFSVSALQIQSNKLLIKSSDGIYSIDLQENKLEKIYDGKIFATRLAIVDQKLIATFPGPASGFVNLETKEVIKYFNAYDYEPTVSNSNKYVAVISEGASGILIKRIK